MNQEQAVALVQSERRFRLKQEALQRFRAMRAEHGWIPPGLVRRTLRSIDRDHSDPEVLNVGDACEVARLMRESTRSRS